MKTILQQLLVTTLTIGVDCSVLADDVAHASSLDTKLKTDHIKLEFRNTANFERKDLGRKLKIRGWKITDKVYLGQTKIDKKWGFGFVVDHGNVQYGINHTGIHLQRRF